MQSQDGTAVLNRRTDLRKAVRVPATLTCRDAAWQVQTLDLSRSGICVVAPRPFEPGSHCTVKLDVPLADGPATVTLSLKTIYSSYAANHAFKIGGRFVELDDELADILGRFVTGD